MEEVWGDQYRLALQTKKKMVSYVIPGAKMDTRGSDQYVGKTVLQNSLILELIVSSPQPMEEEWVTQYGTKINVIEKMLKAVKNGVQSGTQNVESISTM